MKTTEEEANKKFRRLEANRKKQGEILRKLEGSTCLQFMWPDVFKLGKVKSHWVGNLLHNPKRARLVVDRSDGESRTFLLPDVPGAIRNRFIDGKLSSKEFENRPLEARRLAALRDDDAS